MEESGPIGFAIPHKQLQLPSPFSPTYLRVLKWQMWPWFLDFISSETNKYLNKTFYLSL